MRAVARRALTAWPRMALSSIRNRLVTQSRVFWGSKAIQGVPFTFLRKFLCDLPQFCGWSSAWATATFADPSANAAQAANGYFFIPLDHPQGVRSACENRDHLFRYFSRKENNSLSTQNWR